ncbi:MAG: tRNA (N(6)-L-threonylcarbamoyladenosine(37)-C(2))-methylthiotransferase MtaB [Muribaculaceae bacterium]|nr:tRNA (N(6)-L-threonylcarbamoyladenosine(37)-C(2))-methylthiotransferase MtaB [Muribaculaceae bacterium]
MISQETFQTLTAKYVTLGCKLNFAETSTIAAELERRGVRRANADETPDVIVVNTCSVTAVADKKGRQMIRSLARRWPDAVIVATGCYAQLKPEEVAAIEGVHIVVGNDHKGELPQMLADWIDDRKDRLCVTPAKDIRRFVPSCSRGDRTRWMLKVQDGCNCFCSYCTIPMARGRSRSGSIESLVEQARGAAAAGAKEIVLTGVNIGDFGWQTDKKFIDLIRALDEVEGIERYRISSIEPDLLTDEIIEFTSVSKRFMPHFHIPLQCGDDEMLQLMRRRYDRDLFADRVKHIKRVMPDAFIGVDLIVGMRGETDERYESSKEFVSSLDITRLHVFPYSERPGTRALEIFPVIDADVQRQRTHEMIALSDKRHIAFAKKFGGEVRPVLLERLTDDGKAMEGYTDNYIRVEVEGADASMANRIVKVRLGDAKWVDDGPVVKGMIER